MSTILMNTKLDLIMVKNNTLTQQLIQMPKEQQQPEPETNNSTSNGIKTAHKLVETTGVARCKADHNQCTVKFRVIGTMQDNSKTIRHQHSSNNLSSHLSSSTTRMHHHNSSFLLLLSSTIRIMLATLQDASLMTGTITRLRLF